MRRRTRDSEDTLNVPPSPDIAALETAAESLTRLGDIPNAIALWGLSLRLRQENIERLEREIEERSQ